MGLEWHPEAVLRKLHKLGSLTQQKHVVSQFCRPAVRNQGVSRAILPLKSVGENPFFGVGWQSLASSGF